MYIFLAFIMLTLTIITHCIFARAKNSPSQVFCFICAGFPICILQVGLSIMIFGYSDKAMASILIYAASCQFTLYLFSVVSNGVSASVLAELFNGADNLCSLDMNYSTKSMVIRRINQLQIDGFLHKKNGMLIVTAKGKTLIRSFSKLRAFFGHESHHSISN